MPTLKSAFEPSFLFKNKHVQTVFPYLFVEDDIQYQRERFELSDGDFIDLDWKKIGSSRLVVILHGLEGSSRSHYARRLTNYMTHNGFDVVVLNFRGCSGETNRLFRSYHSGATEDLAEVLQAVTKSYSEIYLTGYSLGGNVLLKYLGEYGSKLHENIKAAATVSVPCDLHGCAEKMAERKNQVYMNHFLKKFGRRMRAKKELFPEKIDLERFIKIKTFEEFDDFYTAPAHGFVSARDYYQKNRSLNFISDISFPTLLITAQDDPFLTSSCVPKDLAKDHKDFHLEISERGGHVGFVSAWENYYLQERIHWFFEEFS